MTRIFALPVIAILTTIAALAADQLPSQSEESDSFDIEPPLLEGNFSDKPSPATPGVESDVGRLQKTTGARKEKCGERGTSLQNWRAIENGGGATFLENRSMRVRPRKCVARAGKRR